jgi:hypothetical protein
MGARKSESDIAAIAVADHIDGSHSEHSDDLGRIVGHVLIREWTRIVGAVAVASLVNADDGM